MNILFYTPFNLRSRDTESLMQAFIKQGHKVFLLTQIEEGIYHEACAKLGVSVSTYVIPKNNSILYFLKHTKQLITYCKKNQIDVVYAHLETAALPAILAQYFIKTKVFACRHIIDEAYLFNNKNFIRLNKIVYTLAKNIIVVSQHSKDFMVIKEKINPSKITVIRLAYNFDFYNRPNFSEVEKIKKQYNTQLLFLTACRLVNPKRPEYSIQVAKHLLSKGLDIKLLILGTGPEADVLQALINKEKLNERVFLLGFKINIIDYITACDVMIHPSILDSSSVIIKEAGLAEKTIIACKHIGDVDEYLVNRENAFLVSQDNTVKEMTEIATELYADRTISKNFGSSLKEKVLNRFSIDNILPQYDQIHNTIKRA